MEEIDRQFRPGKDFMVAWVLVAAATVAIFQPWRFDLPWFSQVAFAVVIPFLATFAVYGPVLLIRQAKRSGARGKLVLSAYVETVFITAVMLVVSRFVIFRDHELSPILVLLISVGAIAYLNVRIRMR